MKKLLFSAKIFSNFHGFLKMILPYKTRRPRFYYILKLYLRKNNKYFLSFSDGTLEKSNVQKPKRSYYLYKMSMEHFWSEIPNHDEMIIHYPFEMETQSNIIGKNYGSHFFRIFIFREKRENFWAIFREKRKINEK